MASKTVKKIVDHYRQEALENGKGSTWVATTDIAKLIRVKLREAFPGVKFSVRCSRGSAISIYWTDGPLAKAVDAIVKSYAFGGFDGSIDMAYSSSNWLHPDGTMSAASSTGTQDSLGYSPAYTSDCPTPGAVLVDAGTLYVFTQREVSAERWMQLIRLVEQRYDFTFDESLPTSAQRVERAGREYLYTVARDIEQDVVDPLTGELPQPEPKKASTWCNWVAWT